MYRYLILCLFWRTPAVLPLVSFLRPSPLLPRPHPLAVSRQSDLTSLLENPKSENRSVMKFPFLHLPPFPLTPPKSVKSRQDDPASLLVNFSCQSVTLHQSGQNIFLLQVCICRKPCIRVTCLSGIYSIMSTGNVCI